MELSKEELMNYGTGAWYFEEEEVAEITHYLHYDETTVSLEEILPQHYHNNYRFAYWILKYGYLPGVLLILMVISLFGIMFVVTGKIRNKLGHTLALACSVCLSSQMLLYLLGNLGYQYASFSTLPFISEGLCSITTNMILVGCVLSAYRYDRVIREEKYLNTVIKA
jgi:cell division protein FtsW (lipid II flippase)